MHLTCFLPAAYYFVLKHIFSVFQQYVFSLHSYFTVLSYSQELLFQEVISAAPAAFSASPDKGGFMPRRTFDRSTSDTGSFIDMKTQKPVKRTALPIICERIRYYRELAGIEQKELAG